MTTLISSISVFSQNPNYRPRIHNLNQNAQQNLADLIAQYTTAEIIEQHECMPTMVHAHTNRFIFPWHRIYLENFEDWMHKKNVAYNALLMPGWDPTEQLPSPFYVNSSNCQDVSCPGQANGNCDNFTGDHPNIALPDYTNVQDLNNLGAFLQDYHRDVHDGVGGAFSTMRSPAGYMFFPWHAYFDEIWQDWDCNYFSGSEIKDRPDYFIKDTPHFYGSNTVRLYDAGAEDLQKSSFNYKTYISEYIWVRNQADGFTNQYYQRIKSSATNYIYVKVRNRGCEQTPSGDDEIELRWSASQLEDSKWPEDWDGTNSYYGSQLLPMGGLIGQITMSQSIDIGRFRVFEYEWNTPDFNPYFAKSVKYSPLDLNISIMARILSSVDPDSDNTDSDIEKYVQKNNNVSRRSGFAPYVYWLEDATLPVSDPDVCCFIIENPDTLVHASRLYFDIPEDEWSNHFFNYGYLYATLDDSLYAAWVANGSRGAGITDVGNPIRIESAGSYLEDLTLASGDYGQVCMHAQVSEEYRITDGRSEFRVDVQQVNAYGDSLSAVRLYADLTDYSSESSLISTVSDRMQRFSNNIAVYPNPTYDIVNWKVDKQQSVRYYLMDVNGKILQNGQDISGSIPVTNYPSGVYFLRFEDKNGVASYFKLVKM